MNIFYYPAYPSEDAERYLHDLQVSYGIQWWVTGLPGGCRLNSPLCLNLRSGDIIILFATNPAELDQLLVLRQEFEAFRIILVLPYSSAKDFGDKPLLLAPRFITTPQDKVRLAAVIDRMLSQDMNNTSEPTLLKEDNL